MDQFLRFVGRVAAVLLLPVGVILALAGLVIGAALPVALEPGRTLAGMRQQPELYPALAPLTLAALAEALPQVPASTPEETSLSDLSEATAPDMEIAEIATRLEYNAGQLAAGGEVDAAALLEQIAADASALAEVAAASGATDLAETARALATTAGSLPPEVLVETAGQVAAGVRALPAPSAETPPAAQHDGPLTLAEIIAALPADAWAGLARQIAPPDWVEAQIGATLAAAQRGEVAALDTDTLHAALTGQPGTLLASQITALARPCTTDETSAWAEGLTPALCNPAETGLTSRVEAAVRDTLAEAADGFAALPNPFALARLRSPLVLTGPSGAALVDWLQDEAVLGLAPDLLRELSIALFAAPLVVIALLVLVGTRSLEWWAIWAGLVGLLTGGLILLGAAQAEFLIRAAMSWLALAPTLSAAHALAARLIEGTLRGLALQLPLALQSVLVWVLVGGGLLVFLGVFARRLLPIEEE